MVQRMAMALVCTVTLSYGLSGCSSPAATGQGSTPTAQVATRAASGKGSTAARRAALRGWLQSVNGVAGHCVHDYGAMTAQLSAALSGGVAPGALDAQVAQERLDCSGASIPALPALLAGDKKARAAFTAISHSVSDGHTAADALPDIVDGNTNARQVQDASSALDRAVSEYKSYTKLVGSLKRRYGVE